MCPERRQGPQAPGRMGKSPPNLPPVPTAEAAALAQEPVKWDPVLVDPGPIPVTRRLPPQAVVYVPGNKPAESVGLVRWGDSGYYPVVSPVVEALVDHDEGRALVKRLNAALGVSPIQSFCMLVGSMCGWNSPEADPANYTPEDVSKLQ